MGDRMWTGSRAEYYGSVGVDRTVEVTAQLLYPWNLACKFRVSTQLTTPYDCPGRPTRQGRPASRTLVWTSCKYPGSRSGADGHTDGRTQVHSSGFRSRCNRWGRRISHAAGQALSPT